MKTFEIPKKVTILGTTYNTEDYTSRSGTYRVIPLSIPKHMVVPFEHNRKVKKPKQDTLQKSVQNTNGNFRVYPIFLENENGQHELFDAHHLFDVDGFDSDELISVALHWWVNPNSDEDKLDAVRIANKDQSPWDLIDYLVSNAEVVGGPYTHMLKYIDTRYPCTRPGTIVAAFTGVRNIGQDNPIKTGELEFTSFNYRVGDYFAKNLQTIINSKYKRKVTSYLTRCVAKLFFETAEEVNGDVNNEEFRNFTTHLFEKILTWAEVDKIKGIREPEIVDMIDGLKERHLSKSVLKAA